jgi:hypothetical protein
MIASIRILPIVVLVVAVSTTSPAATPSAMSPDPDAISLRDGSVVKGLIVRNKGGDVTIQTAHGEETYTRAQITRVNDAPGEGMYLTDIKRKGSLPPWRTLVNDLRHNDGVTSLEQIPATVIDNGEFKNVPYLSFRINGAIEMNIYGDPDDPAGVELGIYGANQGDKRLRRRCREFLVSYLNSREEISAVYKLKENGGIRKAGDMTVEYTPASAPDAYGAWWISIYNRKHLADARLTDAEYTKLTRPVSDVIDQKGQVRETAWTTDDTDESLRLKNSDNKEDERLFIRGFYRDKDGDFHATTAP